MNSIKTFKKNTPVNKQDLYETIPRLDEEEPKNCD